MTFPWGGYGFFLELHVHNCSLSLIVKPHLTREEFLQTEFVVNEFASGVGKELQRKLEIRGKSMRNWVIMAGLCFSFIICQKRLARLVLMS